MVCRSGSFIQVLLMNFQQFSLLFLFLDFKRAMQVFLKPIRSYCFYCFTEGKGSDMNWFSCNDLQRKGIIKHHPWLIWTEQDSHTVSWWTLNTEGSRCVKQSCDPVDKAREELDLCSASGRAWLSIKCATGGSGGRWKQWGPSQSILCSPVKQLIVWASLVENKPTFDWKSREGLFKLSDHFVTAQVQ